MARPTQVRIAFQDLARKYGQVASNLEFKRGAASRKASALREPIMAILKPLVEQRVTSLAPDDLTAFDAPVQPGDRGMSISEFAAAITQRNQRYQELYDEYAAYDKGRDQWSVRSSVNDMRHQSAELERTLRRYGSVLEPIEKANRFLRHMKAPEISAETAREYSYGNVGRWLSDPAFRAARAAVTDFEKRSRKAGISGRLSDVLQAYEQTKTQHDALPTQLADARKELIAAERRDDVKPPDALVREVQERILRSAYSASYVEHLAAQDFTEGALEHLIGDAVKAEALDKVAGNLSSAITAARRASGQFNDKVSDIYRAERKNRNGRVRGINLSDLEAKCRRFSERAGSAGSVASKLTEGIDNFRFDAPRTAASARPSSAQLMYLTLAAAVLVTLDSHQQSMAAGQLEVSGRDFSDVNLGVDVSDIGQSVTGGLALGCSDIGVPSTDIHVNTPSDLDTGSTGFGFGLGGFE